MFVGVLMYALSGGADFGSGFYDLTAGCAERGARVRSLIDHSIGPVWEANHVWLIYIMVFAWTGVPHRICVRHDHTVRPADAGPAVRRHLRRRLAHHAVLPRRRSRRDRFWTSPSHRPRRAFWLVAATHLDVHRRDRSRYLLPADAQRSGDRDLAENLRVRALAVGTVTGAVVGLLGRGLPLVVASIVAGVAQYPWILTDQVRIDAAAGAPATLKGPLVVASLAAVLVVPALGYLYWLTQSDDWTSS